MEDNVSKIKDRLNVVDVISEYIKIQKAGVNFKGRCPFHNEKSASFVVSPERQIWHCFGCGAGGDMFGFIKQIEGVEFIESLKILATKAGVELSKFDNQSISQQGNIKDKIYVASELATRFYEKQLWQSDVGKKVLAYLKNRGVTETSIKAFRLGYAPDGNNLKQFLESSGYNNNELVTAGLLGKSEDGRYYDRFRSRIMFPIMDIHNRVVAFSGRIFETIPNDPKPATLAKYINSPQTPVYDKSRILYGLNYAKLDIRKKQKCLVVEGNLDVVMSHQAGATYAVASSGTALTDGHLQIIKRYTDNIDLCFDSDNAGQLATDRGVDLALAHGFNVGIVSIDENGIKDAADYVQKHGEQWQDYTDSKSQPFMAFYTNKLAKTYDVDTAFGKKMISSRLIPLIKTLPNQIEQNHWINELALLLKLKEEILLNELSKTSPRVEIAQDSRPAQVNSSPVYIDPLEEILVSIIMKEPSLLAEVSVPLDLVSDPVRNFINSVTASGNKNNKNFDETIRNADQKAILALEFSYLRSQELWNDFKKEELADEMRLTINKLQQRIVTAQLNELEFQIRQAEHNKDTDKLAELAMKFNELIK